MKKFAVEKKIAFSYLVDDTQQVAKRYGAVCTPDPFLFDKQRKLVFHGRIDNAMKPDDRATEKTMIVNIEKLLSGQPIPKDFDPSIGCSIKWKN
jgi:peroxiredoxin